MAKIGAFFKKAWAATVSFCKKAWAATVAFCKKAWAATVAFTKKAWAATVAFTKKAWAAVKTINWTATVRPVVAWSVFGGVVALAVVLMLIFWL